MLIGAGGGSLLGLLTAPDRADGTAQAEAPAQQVAPSTTRRPKGRFAGVSSTTRHRPRAQPTVTGTPATTARPTTTTARPTTTTTRATTTTTAPSTTTTTLGDATTSSSRPSTSTSTT
jgi:hypothetical protein